MPVFRPDRALGVARNLKALFMRSETPGAPHDANRRILQYSEMIEKKEQELSRVGKGIRSTEERTRLTEYRRRRKRLQEEIFQLESELRALQEGAGNEQETGALPDFAIIGARKAGTTFLYNLLTRHPHVEPAAAKEVHYFDSLIVEEDTEWYKRCFPKPRYRDGRRTITGEATPYMANPRVPEKMAQVMPQARLIALLRNPVERAYSDYQHVVSRGREPLTFEEATRLEQATMETGEPRPSEQPSGKRGEVSQGEDGLDGNRRYLYRSIYIDQLLRWSRFFGEDRMLVLKSEDLFEHTPENLKAILEFLGLGEWEPETWTETPKERNEGKYKRRMDPATRRRLEGFFEPHNQRLYEYLGVDLGW